MRAIYRDVDIIAAGERLRAERPGGVVSPWDIIKALGGRGKLERIERIWLAHLDETEETAVAPAIVETPLPPRLAETRDADLARVASSLAAVSGVVSSLYASTWAVADEVAQGRVAAERQLFADQRVEFERQETLARELQAASELREEALEARVEDLDQGLALARTDATRLTERLGAAEAEAARAAERAASEIGRLSASLSVAEAAVAEARREAASASATAAAAQADAERSRSEIAAVRLDLDGAAAALAEVRQDAAAAAATAAAAQGDAERARAETAAVRLSLEEVRAHQADLSIRLATADAKAAAAAEELGRERQATASAAAAARGDVDRLQEEVDSLRKELEASRAAKAGIEASLAAAEARAEAVACELERERRDRVPKAA